MVQIVNPAVVQRLADRVNQLERESEQLRRQIRANKNDIPAEIRLAAPIADVSGTKGAAGEIKPDTATVNFFRFGWSADATPVPTMTRDTDREFEVLHVDATGWSKDELRPVYRDGYSGKWNSLSGLYEIIFAKTNAELLPGGSQTVNVWVDEAQTARQEEVWLLWMHSNNSLQADLEIVAVRMASWDNRYIVIGAACPSGGGGGLGPTRQSLTIVTENVIPTLLFAPTLPEYMTVTIQGIDYIPNYTPGLTLSGDQLTWVASTVGFDLEVGDELIATYE